MTMLVLATLFACGGDEPEEDKLGPPPERVAADQPGPYQVGARTYEIADDRSKEPLVVEVWYPAVVPDGRETDFYPEIAVQSGAYRDTEPDLRGAPYPLVVFSHGFGGVRYQNAFLTEHLASHGYVVVAVDHRFSTIWTLDFDKFAQVFMNRPGDVIRGVDGVLAQPEMDGVADSSRYLMTGHSFGGMTTLLTLGGKLDTGFGLTYCETHDVAGCDFFENPKDFEDTSAVENDPRAIAGVDISPAGWYAFGERGLDGIEPVLAIAGAADHDLPYDEEALPTMEHLPPPAHLVTLEGAGHFTPTDLCQILPFYEECAGEDGWMPADRAHDVVKTLVTAWATRHLLESDADDHWLDPKTWRGDVTLEIVR